jgi:diguanylate cyclase (GGDEF)-like protein
LLLDIDHFKEINDTYGHHIGDKALKHVTQLCEQCLRQSDIFGRIGGEEFGVVLPDTDTKQGEDIANRIRVMIMDNPFTDSEIHIKITVSIGLASLQYQEHFDALIQHADTALYQAKNQGRNRVVVAG